MHSSSVVVLSVGPLVTSVYCGKMDLLDRDAVWRDGSGEFNEPCIGCGSSESFGGNGAVKCHVYGECGIVRAPNIKNIPATRPLLRIYFGMSCYLAL